jgi:hypothetical protein
MKHYTHDEALFELTSFMDMSDSGEGYFRELGEISLKFPEQPFSMHQLDWLVNFSPSSDGFVNRATVFAKAGHTEVLPLA